MIIIVISDHQLLIWVKRWQDHIVVIDGQMYAKYSIVYIAVLVINKHMLIWVN